MQAGKGSAQVMKREVLKSTTLGDVFKRSPEIKSIAVGSVLHFRFQHEGFLDGVMVAQPFDEFVGQWDRSIVTVFRLKGVRCLNVKQSAI